MLERYIDFDQIVKQMIAQHQDNMAALESLTQQYTELLEQDGVTAVQYHKASGKGSTNNDWMINQIIQRQMVKKKIDDLNDERELFDKAWEQLKDEERVVLEHFFMHGQKPGDAVEFLCSHFQYERPTAYRRKDEALKRFKRLLFG